MIKRIMLLLAFIIILIPIVSLIIGAYISAPRYGGPASDHFNGKQFINPGGVKSKGYQDVLKWMLNRKSGKWTENKNEAYGKHPIAIEKENIRITFINHSTFLIQVDGLNILTDPIWSKRTSPFALGWA